MALSPCTQASVPFASGNISSSSSSDDSSSASGSSSSAASADSSDSASSDEASAEDGVSEHSAYEANGPDQPAGNLANHSLFHLSSTLVTYPSLTLKLEVPTPPNGTPRLFTLTSS